MTTPDSAAPKVSVVVMTYNHRGYIEQALDSVLAQRTAFPWELLISEDCSTDGTREIVIDYQRRYPERIRLLLSERNLRSNAVVARGINAARGQYIAMLDGDDYWIRDDKLQRQADFLDAHPECTMCFHNARVDYEDGSRPSWNWVPADQKPFATLEDMWMGNFIPMCSAMYRNGVIGRVPDWYAEFDMSPTLITDWQLHLLHAEHGLIGYLDEVMGVYRQHGGGLYSRFSEQEKQAMTLALLPQDERRDGGPASVTRGRGGFAVLPRMGRGVCCARRESARPRMLADLPAGQACQQVCLATSPAGGLGTALVAAGARGRPSRPGGSAVNPHCARIEPVDSALARPVWSVMIPTYHCARYLGETLRSVLAQDPGPDAMQIEVVDDHSTQDDPESVVREVGRGRVGFFRQPANVGITRNFATCITRSRGRLVHLLHGDDTGRRGLLCQPAACVRRRSGDRRSLLSPDLHRRQWRHGRPLAAGTAAQRAPR